MVSVIIPVYNAEKYLDKALSSVTNQTYHDIEIICIDDGSTDNSKNIIDNYIIKDKRIKYLYEDNSGPGVARNTGLAVATGKYIVFVDADDVLPNNALEILFNNIDEGNYDVVIGSYKSISDTSSGELVEPYKLVNEFDRYFRSLSVWGKIFRKDFINGIEFENTKYGEDSVFLVDVYLRRPKVLTIANIVYYWMRNSNDNANSLTFQYDKGIFDGMLNAAILRKERFINNDTTTKEMLDNLNRHLINTTAYFRNLLLESNLDKVDLKKYYEYVLDIKWDDYMHIFKKVFESDISCLSSYDIFKEHLYKIYG